MLHLYRRHLEKCGRRSRQANCSCPVWVQGVIEGTAVRKSLDLRNWEAAQKRVRDWEAGGELQSILVSDALDKFIADCQERNLRWETVRKYKLLEKEHAAWFGSRPVAAIGIAELAEYRSSWKLSPHTVHKKIERLRAFFRFCLERGWIRQNPAKLLKSCAIPRYTKSPTLPFTDEEIVRIFQAAERYLDIPKGRTKQVKAFISASAYGASHTGRGVP